VNSVLVLRSARYRTPFHQPRGPELPGNHL